ncbi:SDR family NAD(P)-dependent oxidoreductase [Marinicaulis aureus]|uniref:SDR family NAD(P)-dependent oxidoreductase n=1 Tax=Hyphococcus aureus TaxID=2666033 RepID=A0ABW1KWY2_9PROT
MSDLTDKTVLVTGASRGIGAATAKAAQKAGARVLLHASAPSDAAEQAAAVAGGEVIFEDLSAPGAGARVMAGAVKAAGRLDAVVNNAGIYIPTPLAGGEEEWADGWAQTMAVNVQAPADICRAAITHFRATGGGIVVNVASRAGHRGDGPDHAAYAASKGAVLAMTKTYARALSGENILFYAIAPGWVETRMAPQDIENRKNAIRDIPLGRVASPDEVAEMILFCASGACPSATGATFDVNGASYVR